VPHLRWVENALLQPCSGTLRRINAWHVDGGVYDAAGALVPAARHGGDNTRHLAPERMQRDDLAPLPGRWLFGGWLQEHFGHYLAYGLGRLWPFPALAAELDGVAFLCLRDGAKPTDPLRNRGVSGMLACLGVGNRVSALTVREPTRFAQLAVPQHLLIGRPGTPPDNDTAFLALLRSMRASPLVQPAAGAESLYVSRRLLNGKGGIMFEGLIERNLAAEGYTIVHPETLSVPEQLGLYAGARRLIFAEGSALHLATACLDPNDKVAIVARRQPIGHDLRRWLAASGVRDPTIVQAIRGAISFTVDGRISDRERPTALAVLHLARVRNQLARAGFCKGADWQIPTEDEMQARIAEVLARRRARFPRRDVRFLPADVYAGRAPAPAPTAPG
jgi:hypothetical protein